MVVGHSWEQSVIFETFPMAPIIAFFVHIELALPLRVVPGARVHPLLTVCCAGISIRASWEDRGRWAFADCIISDDPMTARSSLAFILGLLGCAHIELLGVIRTTASWLLRGGSSRVAVVVVITQSFGSSVTNQFHPLFSRSSYSAFPVESYSAFHDLGERVRVRVLDELR